MVADLRGVTGSLAATFLETGAGPETSASPPLELRGPFSTGEGPPVYMLRNVTAGIFAGDRLGVSLRTGTGATAHVTPTSATKVHSMPTGYAESRLSIDAGCDSLFVYGPAPLILQAGADFQQSTELAVGEGARLVYSEVVAFGRAASGERLAFRRFASEMSAPGYAESFTLSPSANTPSIEASLAAHDALGTLLAYGFDPDAAILLVRARLDAIAGVFAGASVLPSGGVIVKLLASHLETARTCLADVSAMLAGLPAR